MISEPKLIELYSAMIRSRMLAERAGTLKQQGKLTGDLRAGLGREGTIAGMTVDLQREDTLGPSRCDFVSSVIKGMPLEQMFSRLGAGVDPHSHADATMAFDEQSNIIAPASELDSRMEVARGAALVHKVAKNGRVVVVTCANGSAAQQSWRDAVAFAENHELPMIFVWHNDAGDQPLAVPHTRRRNRKPATRKPRPAPAITVDGTDAVAVYRVASESIHRARLGCGPTLIECRATAASPSTNSAGSDPADPIGKMELYLAGKGLPPHGLRQRIADTFLPQLDGATRFL